MNLLSSYAKTLTILEQYDKGELKELKGGKTKFVLTYEHCLQIIKKLRKELMAKNEAGICLEMREMEVLKGLFAGFTRHSAERNYIRG